MKKIIIPFILFLIVQFSFSQNWVRKLDGIGMWSLCKDCSGNVYAGTSGSVRCIFKSTNGGTSWDTVLSNGVTNFLYMDCDSSTNVYAANVSNGVMKSSNCGMNWTNIPPGTFNNQNVNSIACGRNGLVFAGATLGGIYRSTDYGVTFTNTALQGLTIVCIEVDRFNSNIIYAGASSSGAPNYGFYRSTDGGLTFSENLNPLNIWGIYQKANGNLYTVTTSSGYPFSKSTNGGLNWTTVSNFAGAMRGLCGDMMENIYTAGNGGVFRSTNDGASFVNFGLTYSSNQVICFQNKILVAVSGTTNGGVYVFTDTLVGVKEPRITSPKEFYLSQNYPNPFNPTTKIKFSLPFPSKRGVMYVQLLIFDIIGRKIASLIPPLWGEREGLLPGTYEVEWNASNYPSGVYFYQLVTGDFKQTKRMVLLK